MVGTYNNHNDERALYLRVLFLIMRKMTDAQRTDII